MVSLSAVRLQGTGCVVGGGVVVVGGGVGPVILHLHGECGKEESVPLANTMPAALSSMAWKIPVTSTPALLLNVPMRVPKVSGEKLYVNTPFLHREVTGMGKRPDWKGTPPGNRALLPGTTYVNDGNSIEKVTFVEMSFEVHTKGKIAVRLQKKNVYFVEQLPMNWNWNPASILSPSSIAAVLTRGASHEPNKFGDDGHITFVIPFFISEGHETGEGTLLSCTRSPEIVMRKRENSSIMDLIVFYTCRPHNILLCGL